MLNQFEHHISEKSIQLAQKHSQQINKLRESLEKFGKTLQAKKIYSPEFSLFIIKQSQAIEQLIKKTEDSLIKLKETSSVKAYRQVAELHAQATLEYTLTVDEYLKQLKLSLN